jgi:serine/threonine protein kinase
LYLYPFIETVCFIHDNLKQVHLALSFDNIYITADGKWKIAGFGCNQTISGDELAPFEEKLGEYAFAAPEVATQKMFNKKSDIFSIGVIIVNLLEYLYKSYKPVAVSDKNEYEKAMASFKNVSALPVVAKSKNPGDLEQLLKNLLQW